MIDVLGLLCDGELDAHSAICLTYNLDLCFYDHYVRRALRSARVQNQILLCDASQYQQALVELMHAPRCGKQYSVTPCRASGAFHPKMYLILGAKTGRLVVGSGNLSVGGLVRNAELFGVFDFRHDEEAPHPAFAEVIAFVGELVANGSDALRVQFERATGASPWLRLPSATDGRTLLLGGPRRPPLIDRMAALLEGRTVKDLVVCSASFDRSLDGLHSLAALTQKGRLTCIVQPENTRIDGAAVRRLGKQVDWRPFVDPYPAEKKQRRDVRAHEKLFVFNCGGEELVLFGSANASAPALFEAGGNVESLVALPWLPAGTAFQQLGLGESLEAKGIFSVVAKKTWAEDDEDDDQPVWAFDLISALVEADAIILTFATPPTTKQLATLQLEVADSPGRPFSARFALRAGSQSVEAGIGPLEPWVRCGRVVDGRGAPVSNYVALTWAEVRGLGVGHSLNARYSQALAAMQDGMVLGTILFELLDRFRDFEVVFSRGGDGEADDETEPTGEDDARPTEAFYSDSLPGAHDAARWLGDRADLDLVASLIQPLKTPQGNKRTDDDDDDSDDDVLAEEQERRGIDAKKGAATGEERATAGTANAKAMVRATSRLARRLVRAAKSVESALQAKDEKKLKEIALPSLARQVWMTHIAAFLAGRTVTSSDAEEVLCLEKEDFAEYVLRVCRALAGGKAGGLLALLPESAWQGTDGEHAKRGLAFVETCCLWAVWWVRDYWERCDDSDVCANGIWDSVPELIGARLLNALRGHVVQPDMEDLERRLPLIADVGLDALKACRDRLEVVASALRDIDAATPPKSSSGTRWRTGDLVWNGYLGISFVTGTDGDKVHLSDLSKGDDCRRTYLSSFVAPVRDPRLMALSWRPVFDGDE